MNTRRSLRLISLLLKLCSVLVFLFMVVADTVNALSFQLRSMPIVPIDWLQFGYRIGSTLLTGLIYMLFTYGGAKAIDLLIEISNDVRSVGSMVYRLKPKSQQQPQRESQAPHAPNPENLWEDYAGSIRDGRNIVGYTYNANGERVYGRTMDKSSDPRIAVDSRQLRPVPDRRRRPTPKVTRDD